MTLPDGETIYSVVWDTAADSIVESKYDIRLWAYQSAIEAEAEMEAKAKRDRESLGWIYLLPSNTSSCIIKYAPKWTISCVIPNAKREIVAHYYKYHDFDDPTLLTKDLEIETPDLIWSHSFKTPWTKHSKLPPYFSLFAIDLEQDALFTVPYRIANVYSSGAVCFGDSTTIPGNEIPNLRRANNYFWSSPFNQDNCPYKDLHRKTCDSRQHEWYDHYEPEACDCCDCGDCDEEDACRCECCIGICGCGCDCKLDVKFFDWITTYHKRLASSQFIKKNNFFCGEKYFACPRPTKAIFISNNPQLLETVPKNNWRRDYRNTSVVIGVASKNYNDWEIDLGSFQLKLGNDKVRMI